MAIQSFLVASFLVVTPSHAAACSPTETTDGLYTVLTFSTTGTCTWTVPTGITSLDSLVVAGGGGGGGGTITYAPDDGAGGAGGGGGQVIETTSRSVSESQIVTFVVGSGGNGASGTGRNYYGNYGYPGGISSISLASGWSTTAGAGGGSIVDSSKYNLVAWGAARARLGGALTGNPNIDLINGGYGGGSGNANVGSNPSGRQGGQGASDNSLLTPSASVNVFTGVSSSISGAAIIYGNGGGGGNLTTQGLTGTTYGSGGGGGKSADVASPNDSYGGNNGLSGVVIIRFLTYVVPASQDDLTETILPKVIDPCAASHKITIYFEGGVSSLDKNDLKKIKSFSTLVNSCSFTRLNISGFTSIDKPDTPNYALFRKNLSNKRDQEVKNSLLSKLDKKNKKIKVYTYAKSNSNPKKSNKSEKTRSLNRRVEIVAY